MSAVGEGEWGGGGRKGGRGGTEGAREIREGGGRV